MSRLSLGWVAHCEGVSGIEWLPTRIAVSAKSLSFKAVLVSHVNWLPSFENSRIFLLNDGLPMISLHPLISSTSPQLFFTFVKSFTLTLFFFLSLWFKLHYPIVFWKIKRQKSWKKYGFLRITVLWKSCTKSGRIHRKNGIWAQHSKTVSDTVKTR